MEATEALRREHRVIERVLVGLELIAAAGQSIDRERAEKALEILRNFADRCHHGKEERHLFRLMEQHGMPRGSGPLAVMLREHDEGRGHVRAMAEALPSAASGDSAAVKTFAEHARAYAALLREHVGKEDRILYPMAEQALSPDEDQQLVAAFDAIERAEMGDGAHEQYHRWAHELAEGA